MTATTYEDVEAVVDAIIDRLGTEVVVGTPLGIGKPNHILNELVERALDNEDIDLEIWSALTLSKPDWDSNLEQRLVEPLADRLFGAYPNLTYDRLLQNGGLPENIEVHQFYYQPGKHMNDPEAQQHHHSVNYTHALGAFTDADPNLLLQLVGIGELDGERYFNLGSNPDLSHDLIHWLHDQRESGNGDRMVVGQVTENMPFMYGDAPVPDDDFDAVLSNEEYEFPLFGPPSEPVSLADQAIGLRVSSLLPDGGTLQIGIGSLGDAIGWATELRHQDNGAYRDVIDALAVVDESPELVSELGGLDTFEEGLYGSTEMFVEAFLHLYESGVLSRAVYDDLQIQRLVEDGTREADIDRETLDALIEDGAISAALDREDVEYLKEWGIFRSNVEYEDGTLVVDGESIPADLSRADVRNQIAEHALGASLDGGSVLHGGFFMGSPDFYEQLRELDEQERKELPMRSVQFTNHLYGEEQLKRLQRQDARFANTGMKATVTGGVVSDGLADGRVISGVGGQFNFVNQAHELDDGRSIIMVRATRESSDGIESNIVWNYGHLTIPRHLRDIVVTEYGMADLRGKSDAEVIASMIQLADSRFQDELVEKAKAAQKLPQDWEIPEQYRNNHPEKLERALGPYRERDVLPEFPYGTAIMDEERTLGNALQDLNATIQNREIRALLDGDLLQDTLRMPETAEPYLERLDLETPSGLRQRLQRRIVVLALAKNDVL
jgi:acyl-CoA hydrolase